MFVQQKFGLLRSEIVIGPCLFKYRFENRGLGRFHCELCNGRISHSTFNCPHGFGPALLFESTIT